MLAFQTETDPIILGYLPATQADSRNFRLWEVAGTAHADSYVLSVSATDANTQAGDDQLFAQLQDPPSSINIGGFVLSCTSPFNTGEQHYVFQTALHDLTVWVRTGSAPQRMPRLSVDSSGAYRRDADGNVLEVSGHRRWTFPSLRCPACRRPTRPASASSSGQTIPFTAAELAARYATHDSFAHRWRRDVARDLRRGYLLSEDAARLDRVVR